MGLWKEQLKKSKNNMSLCRYCEKARNCVCYEKNPVKVKEYVAGVKAGLEVAKIIVSEYKLISLVHRRNLERKIGRHE